MALIQRTDPVPLSLEFGEDVGLAAGDNGEKVRVGLAIGDDVEIVAVGQDRHAARLGEGENLGRRSHLPPPFWSIFRDAVSLVSGNPLILPTFWRYTVTTPGIAGVSGIFQSVTRIVCNVLKKLVLSSFF